MTKKTSEKTDLEFQVQYSVAKVFEPAKVWQKHWAVELATSLESLERMQQLAAATLEPMKRLCEDMRDLLNAFAPLRAFQEQLGVLEKSFAPMKELHQKLALMLEDSGAPFIQLAKSLELTKLSPQRIARLASTFEAAAEIQAEFDKFTQAFNRTSPATLTKAQKAAEHDIYHALCAVGWLARRQSSDILAGRRVRPVPTTSVASTRLPASFPVDRAPCHNESSG